MDLSKGSLSWDGDSILIFVSNRHGGGLFPPACPIVILIVVANLSSLQ